MCRFDGDGMVHAVRMKGGKASYSNHLVQTHRLKRELKMGFPLYLRVRYCRRQRFNLTSVAHAMSHHTAPVFKLSASI